MTISPYIRIFQSSVILVHSTYSSHATYSVTATHLLFENCSTMNNGTQGTSVNVPWTWYFYGSFSRFLIILNCGCNNVHYCLLGCNITYFGSYARTVTVELAVNLGTGEAKCPLVVTSNQLIPVKNELNSSHILCMQVNTDTFYSVLCDQNCA
jgi:hypothetical protein